MGQFVGYTFQNQEGRPQLTSFEDGAFVPVLVSCHGVECHPDTGAPLKQENGDLGFGAMVLPLLTCKLLPGVRTGTNVTTTAPTGYRYCILSVPPSTTPSTTR